MKNTLPYLLIPFVITACGGSGSGSSSGAVTPPSEITNPPSETADNSTAPDTAMEEKWQYQKITITPNNPRAGSLELSFDNAGNLISAIGTGEDPTKDVYTYDDKNQVISVTEDYTNDGTDDAITRYTYDENGNLTTRTVDTGFDGGIDGTVTNTYNDNNQLTTMSLSATNEGLLVKEVYTYNAQGNPLTTTVDDSVNGVQRTNADGIVDNTTTYTYNDNGTLKEKIRDQFNDKFSFTYNDKKQLSLETVDFNNNGNLDESRSYNYLYDAQGRISEKRKIGETNTLTYGEHGNVSRIAIQRDGNPNLDITYTYKAFDFSGNEVALTINVADRLKDEPYIDSPFFDSYFTYRLRSPVFQD